MSRKKLKRRAQRSLFDLGNAKVILPVAHGAGIALRHRVDFLSLPHRDDFTGLHQHQAELALAREPEALSKKFRYNQRRELRLFEEVGGVVQLVASFTAEQMAAIYTETELFERARGGDAICSAFSPSCTSSCAVMCWY